MSAKRLSLVLAASFALLSFAAVLYAFFTGQGWPLYACVIAGTVFFSILVYTLFKGVLTPLKEVTDCIGDVTEAGPPSFAYQFKEVRELADKCSKLHAWLIESRMRQKELADTIEQRTQIADELRAARTEAEETSAKLQKSIKELEEFALMALRRELKMREIREKFKRFKDEYESGPAKRGLY